MISFLVLCGRVVLFNLFLCAASLWVHFLSHVGNNRVSLFHTIRANGGRVTSLAASTRATAGK